MLVTKKETANVGIEVFFGKEIEKEIIEDNLSYEDLLCDFEDYENKLVAKYGDGE